jgi:hypothetical protein
MLKNESVSSYLSRYTQSINELAVIGEIMDPNSIVRTTLNSFTKPWGPFVRGIAAREIMPTWERLWDDFVQEETRLTSEASGQQQTLQGDEDLALWTKGKKKVSKGGREGPKFGAPPQEESSSGQKKDMSKVKCFVCKKMGHYAGQCPNRKKKKGGTTATAEEAKFQTLFERECAFLICCTLVETTPNIQYIDSGASSHMTSVREHLIDLRDNKVKMEIALGDDTLVRVVGIGIVSFQRNGIRVVGIGIVPFQRNGIRVVGIGIVPFQRNGMPPISFKDVLYVPRLKKNLISVSTLQDRGLEVSFRGTKVLIHPKGSCLTLGQVIGVRDGKLFKLFFHPLHAFAMSSDSSRQLCELWYRRMAHLHHGALGGLGEVTGVPQLSSEHQDVCEGCALGKFTEASFPNSDTRSAGVLDLVHTDVGGPMSRASLSGREYYLTFIDDYSRKTWIYFLKTKSEVFKRFQEFKALVENQTGKKIKVLRSDKRGEYSSSRFVNFCAHSEIRRQMIVPYNPQQNGVAERKNKAITGATRSMLHDQSLPLYLWAKASATAVYLQNRSPTRFWGR